MKITKILLIGFGILCLWLLFWPSEKDHLNAQMAELCKKDGGVKIYETVKLPPEMFDEHGLLRSTKRVKEDGNYVMYFGNDYVSVSEEIDIKTGDLQKGEGQLSRVHDFIRRLSSNKVLGESVVYRRAGGDRWNAGMSSQAICPESIDLFKAIFLTN
jgi:hypothetical protein